ncbi:hypothetical protein MUK42_33534 [Musa troglodytarum]|uniref:Uncharacterized protein n=1 Tax=Musa troglodytarum TaxID=320322 RepID=A0A9E7IJM0_9LILI|nr:hypothetical protein MUK42_33534 [Musa troglodytarum]
MSMEPQVAIDWLRKSRPLRTQGRVDGKWIDAYDDKTLQVPLKVNAILFLIFEGVLAFVGS